jgi:hypothetical protein
MKNIHLEKSTREKSLNSSPPNKKLSDRLQEILEITRRGNPTVVAQI